MAKFHGDTLCVICGTKIEHFEWEGELKNGRLIPAIPCEECKKTL